MKKRFSDEQLISILREDEAGVCARKHAISDATFYKKLWKSCARLRVCRNVVPAGWQVCPCQPAVIRLSVRLLTRSCLYASHFSCPLLMGDFSAGIRKRSNASLNML